MKSIISKVNKNNFFPFVIFFFATASQFFFDIIGSVRVSDDLFKEIVNLRSLLIILSPVLVFGIDQSIIRFCGLVKSIYKIINYISLITLSVCLALFLTGFINVRTLVVLFSVLVYVQCLIFSSLYRISSENTKSQLLINSWRLILYITPLLFAEFSQYGNNIYLIFVFSLVLPLLFLARKKAVVIIPESNKKDFLSYSGIFLIFISMLAFSQYADQLVAANLLEPDIMKRYIYYSALYIAPSTVIATFIGFIIAPKFAKMDTFGVKAIYSDYFKFITLLYPVLFLVLLILEIFITSRIVDFEALRVTEYTLFFIIGYFRLLYVLNSSVIGMKSDKSSLFLFFIFCISGIVIQLSIILCFYQFYSLSAQVLLTSVVCNWLLRNLSASYIVERRL